jgi:spermidine/putrescine transport system permease protein
MRGLGRAFSTTLGAYFGLIVALLYAPLVVIVLFSFNTSTIPAFPLEGFTTHWYRAAFHDHDLVVALLRSLRIAVFDAFVATFLGLLAALGLVSSRLRLRTLVTGVLVLPLVVPSIVLAIGTLILLHQAGLGPSPAATLAAHVVISVPYSILVILPRLRTLDASLDEAARDLGATALSSFRRVTLPLLGPALVSSAIVSFTISFDEYAIASFLMPAGEKTFPIFVYGSSKVPGSRPELLAVAAVVVAASLVLMACTEAGRAVVERRQEGRVGPARRRVRGAT